MDKELSTTGERQADAWAFIAGVDTQQELEPVVAPVRRAERRLASEDIVVAAPMSFAGSAQRIWKITSGYENPWAQIAMTTLAVTLIAGAWLLVLCWYIVFGILLIPYRLIRRSQRRGKQDAQRHRELMAATRREDS